MAGIYINSSILLPKWNTIKSVTVDSICPMHLLILFINIDFKPHQES